MKKEDKVLVLGGTGMVGSAILRKLNSMGMSNVLTPDRESLNLYNRIQVEYYMMKHKPKYIFMAAAECGGIIDNMNHPVRYLRNNLMMQTYVIDLAWICGTEKLLFLGSSCIYPKYSPQPIKEEYLLTSAPEETNEFYAIAKIAGIKLCQAYNKEHNTKFYSINPCNIYGPGDKFNERGHVIGSLIQKFIHAKRNGLSSVDVYGDGSARREFLHVDDLADACVFLIDNQKEDVLNVGSGEDVSIKELVHILSEIVDYDQAINWDTTKPVGMLRKCLDVTKINSMGWSPKISLRDGLAATIDWYKENY